MTYPAILLPAFVQVALIFVLLFWGGAIRVSAVTSGAVRAEDIALGERAWPRRPTLIMNAFHNQFELPLLFFVLVILAMITRKADLLFVVMSWIFVVSRIVHAGIHATSNDIRSRFGAFMVGAIVLLIMWIIFALRILLSAPMI